MSCVSYNYYTKLPNFVIVISTMMPLGGKTKGTLIIHNPLSAQVMKNHQIVWKKNRRRHWLVAWNVTVTLEIEQLDLRTIQ